MFTAIETAKLAALALRAGQQPLDLRDYAAPGKLQEYAQIMESLTVHIGTLTIALSLDRMPPHWRPYRHLSVSDNGRPPNDATFMAIAQAVGMDDSKRWDAELVRRIYAAFSYRPIATHAFELLLD